MSIDFDRRQEPLKGKFAAVACSPEKSGRLLGGLSDMGADVAPLAVLAIREVDDRSALDAALQRLASYSWIIFTSSYAVLFFTRRMRELGVALHPALPAKTCAVGPATAAALKDAGLEVALVPGRFVAEGVVDALAARHGGLGRLAGTRVLLPRAKEARDVIPRELEAVGVKVDVVPCYETVPGRVDPEVIDRMRNSPPDLLVFTSPSAVRNFVSILGTGEGTRLLAGAVVAALGPITAGAVESFGKAPDILPAESTVPALLEAVRQYFC